MRAQAQRNGSARNVRQNALAYGPTSANRTKIGEAPPRWRRARGRQTRWRRVAGQRLRRLAPSAGGHARLVPRSLPTFSDRGRILRPFLSCRGAAKAGNSSSIMLQNKNTKGGQCFARGQHRPAPFKHQARERVPRMAALACAKTFAGDRENRVPRRNGMTIALTVNGNAVSVTAEPDTPLLWVLREHLKLTGTKYGCGVGRCAVPARSMSTARPSRSCQPAVSRRGRQDGHDDRRALAPTRSPAAEGLDRRAGPAMRLLPVRADHAGGRAAGDHQERRRASRSSPTWTATSAAAAPIRASCAPSNAPDWRPDHDHSRQHGAQCARHQSPADDRRLSRVVVCVRPRTRPRSMAVRHWRRPVAGSMPTSISPPTGPSRS